MLLHNTVPDFFILYSDFFLDIYPNTSLLKYHKQHTKHYFVIKNNTVHSVNIH